MIADTTFLSDFHGELERQTTGPARLFASRHREQFLITVISVSEFAVIFDTNEEARRFICRYRVLRLTPEIAFAAADIDRELRRNRLGENDNWIAGFCRYYGQPLISRDQGFDRVRGLRRLAY